MSVLAKQIADRAGEGGILQCPMEASIHVPQIARSADLRTFEDLLDTTDGERAQWRDQLPLGKARLLRRLIIIERPRTHLPRPAMP